jgi:hypothetical protein
MSKTNKQPEFKEGPSANVTGTPGAGTLETSVPESLTTKTLKKTKVKKDFINKIGKISIQPYVDATVENMGLENYNMVVYPSTFQEEQLAAVERNGVIRYITGLDEFSPEVQRLNDPEKKEAVINNIRYVVAELEKQLATNVIKVDDDEFWNKVQLLRPDNHEFWSEITIRCGNEPLFLKPKEDPYDLIKMMAIEAGGFDLVAKSYEDAKAKAKPPKFYLDKEAKTVATRTEYKKIRNRAISVLDDLYGKHTKKLLYVLKVLDGNSTQYKNSTPPDIIYDNLDEYINGNGVEANKERAVKTFMDAVELDMETLKLKCIVKDASFYKFLVHKPDGMIYHAKKSAMLGRNVSDCVEYLKNPMHEEVLIDLLEQVEKYWN